MIKLIKPYISFNEVENEFREIFASGIFTKGEYVEKFSDGIKNYVGSKHAFLMTSATTALTMCLKVLDIQQGDEVIVSDFSFPATVNVVEDLGAIPVFADVSRTTFNMDPDQLEKKINDKTKAVIFVDALGNPGGITNIKSICEKYNIPLIDDAACAIGSSEKNIKSGSIADLSCFSFHPRKLLTTGEGGAITTNHEEYAERLKIKLNHGAKVQDGRLDFVDYGYNYRLADMQCIMGLKQLQKLDSIVKERNHIKNEFCEKLEPLGFKSQKTSPEVIHNVQSMVFVVPEGVNRDELIIFLRGKEIEATIGTYCLSSTSYYRKKYNAVQANSLFLEKNTITLPCYQNVDADYICRKIKEYVEIYRG